MHIELILMLAVAIAAQEDAQVNQAELPNFDEQWNYQDPKATEAKFRALLPQAEAAGNDRYRLELLTQIARAQGLQQKFDDAHQTLDAVEKELAGAPAVVAVRYLLERGRLFNSSRQQEKARPLFLQAWQKAGEKQLDFYAVDAAHMLGIVEQGESALAWNMKALAVAEKSTDQRAAKWRGSLYNNIGWTHHDAGDYDRAIDMFQKALAWQQEMGDAAAIRVARWCVARGLRSLERIDEALAIQKQLLAEFEQAKEKDGYVFEELAECYLALGRDKDARKYFALAHAELSKDAWLTKNEPERIARLKRLAKEGADD